MRQWEVLVTAGRQAVKVIGESKWALGDLALEVEPMGSDGVRNGAYARLEQYAQDIGVEFNDLYEYRKVAAAWSAGERIPAASWSAHKECRANKEVLTRLAAARPDGERIKMSAVREALNKRPARGPAETRYGFSQLDTEAKADLVTEALADPQVRTEVVARTQRTPPRPAEPRKRTDPLPVPDPTEARLNAVAAGGRVPTLEESNAATPRDPTVIEAIDAVAGNEEAWAGILREGQRLLERARRLDPVSPESPVAAQIREFGASWIDLLITSGSRRG